MLAATRKACPARLTRFTEGPFNDFPPLMRVPGASVSHEQKCPEVATDPDRSPRRFKAVSTRSEFRSTPNTA